MRIFGLIGILLVGGLSVARAADANGFDAALRQALTQVPSDELVAGRTTGPTAGERALSVGAKFGQSRPEVIAGLMRIVDQAMSAPTSDTGDSARIMARLALDALATLAGGAELDHLTQVARSAPESMAYPAANSALSTASRVAPEKLPSVARELLKSEDTDPVFRTLDDIAQQTVTSSDPADKGRAETIRGILEEAVMNGDFTQSYVDEVLERNYPSYRASPLRKTVLSAMKDSSIELRKKYATEKLAAFGAAPVSNPEKRAVTADGVRPRPTVATTKPAVGKHGDSGDAVEPTKGRVGYWAYAIGVALLVATCVFFWKR